MKLSPEILIEIGHRPCEEAWDLFDEKFTKPQEPEIIIKWLQEINRYDWLCWLLPRISNRPKYLRMAIYAAESVSHLNNDPGVQDAIDAAKAVLENDTEENRAAARAAKAAAWAAAEAAEWAARAAAEEAAAESAVDAAWMAGAAAKAEKYKEIAMAWITIYKEAK